VQAASLTPAQEDPFIPLQPIDIKAIVANIDRATLQRVSLRRIEFRTTDGFPCLILAAPDYSVSGNCKQNKRRKLLLHTSNEGSTVAVAVTKEQQPHDGALRSLDMGDAAAAAAEQPEVALEHGKKFITQLGGMRALLQTPAAQCATPKGEVLILAPYFVEHSCAYGDEAGDIAALFSAAGYRVTFTCNNPAACPEGPPALEDYIGWSKYAFVMVSTTGDSGNSGESPVILARAPTDFSTERNQDWQAGRMVLTCEGLFALR
jgi:hypothetical protein